ncbi:polysaccharide biosynthesis tyrosine autokinase [Mucilaginibacter daejeonensis]|uniref:GumC family protein n=1 Tax=Mucilaginibacter daejeonensis TaxID=398049 RepID=UPI001D17337E|nr:polysaccharide biosynthesis tyrosine autokinase [Mucilaginibacter daejeonensis]UEG54941.1 polysaccharide biosynthesis tyrosine autokinase [Mucilaginibacter daejeonensis]
MNHNINTKTSGESDSIDLKAVFYKLIGNWQLFVISLVIALLASSIYSYYAHPSWSISSKLLVKDDKSNAQGALSGTLSGDIGSIFNAKSNADNEIQIIKSRTLMHNTVKDMQLNVSLFSKNGAKKREIYEEAPFSVHLIYKSDTLNYREYQIQVLNNKEFNISNSEDEIVQKAKFGQIIHLKQYDVILYYKSGKKYLPRYLVSVQDINQTVDIFSKRFAATLSDKQATTIDLSFIYDHPAKGEAILNRLMQIYLSSNIQSEKQIADSAMAFIDSRIVLVSSELTNIEKKFERFKTNNNIANITEQSKSLVSNASEFYTKLAQQETQLAVVSDLEKYLNNPQNKNIIPSSLVNPADQSFGLAINAYNELLLSKQKALLSYTSSNPVIENLDKQINDSRTNLLRNIETYKKSLQTGRNSLAQQNSGITGQLKQLPSKERNYLDFARQQNLKQELYLFLLQKREETAISRNSTISSSRIVDFAKADFLPFKPKKIIIYAVGFILGLIIPAMYLFVKEFFNLKINSKSDIERITPVTILGEIGHNSDKQSLVTGNNSRSVISEQFRSLRTNLQFVIDSSKPSVILFTSSMSGEGKSFLSLNLGSALSLTDKKVVFMEMDLRKPKLSESIGLDINNGFSNYAISDANNYDYKKLLKPLSFNKNCFLISSGPIPPNPSELLSNGKLERLLENLKKDFDYIIIDCAPVGLVTDALMIHRYVDLTFYVLRQGFTYKSQLHVLNELLGTNKLKNIYLIVNDIKSQKAGYSSYKQAYGYGIEEQDNSVFSKFKFWK